IDLLLDRVGPDARRLLWVLSLANEPITPWLWRNVSEGRSAEDAQLDRWRQILAPLEQLPPQERAQVSPDEERTIKSTIAFLEPHATGIPSALTFEPLLRTLVQSGLVGEQCADRPDRPPQYSCHELVRERTANWIAIHPTETGGRSRAQVLTAYGEHLICAFY